MLTLKTFCTKNRFNLSAGVSYIPFVHNVKKWCEFIGFRLCTVYTVGNSNETHIFLTKQYLGIKAYLQIVTTNTAHILYYDTANFTILNILG